MPVTIAPAATALLEQADARAPDRDRQHDGRLGNEAHQQRPSWHNPNRRRQTVKPEFDPRDGICLGVDLTHDPHAGVDAHALVRAAVARRDPRIYEAISGGQIWTLLRADEGWRPYGGENPHDEHAHLSLTYAHAHDTSPWWLDEEDEMSPAEKALLEQVAKDVRAVKAAVDALTAPRLPGGKDRDPQRIDLGDVLSDDED